MAFSINDTYGITAPVGACVNEARQSKRIGKSIVRDEAGAIKKMRGKKMREVNVTVRGKGDPGFSLVTEGPFSEGTVKPISAEGTEFHDGEYNDFEIQAQGWENPA